MLSLKLVTTLLLFKNVISDLKIDPLVQTNLGLIKGLKATDGDYSMFLGIPYAIVDKENPFGASLPHPIFEDTFEAYNDSARCPQRDGPTNTIIGTLDCLHLNVFTPNSANSNNLLPVLIFIHGGYFQHGGFGRYTYGPKFLVRHDIILVTINYRLGPYGFMCLNTPEIPGNQGLKDQLNALRWIKDNIVAFGGNPDQITLSGHSAGAAAVDFHLMYPGERLFNQVLLQSAVALTPARVIESDDGKPLILAKHFGLKTNDLDEALSFLGSVDTNLIVEASLDLGIDFKACVEKYFDGVEIFIPQHPANSERLHLKNMPVLIGSVDNEFLDEYFDKDTEFFQNLNVFKASLEEIFNFGESLEPVHQNLRDFYVGDHMMIEDDKWNVINFESDFTYLHPIQRAMRNYMKIGASNIYFYVFEYDGGRNMVKYRNNVTGPGATHADELGYLFDVSFITEEPSLKDQAVINSMTTMWTNFVKYGNPTPATSELIPLTWSPITPNKWYCLRIGTDLRLEGRPFHDRMAYWDLFFRKYGHLEKGVEDGGSCN